MALSVAPDPFNLSKEPDRRLVVCSAVPALRPLGGEIGNRDAQ
jgi:hypothetical protein